MIQGYVRPTEDSSLQPFPFIGFQLCNILPYDPSYDILSLTYFVRMTPSVRLSVVLSRQRVHSSSPKPLIGPRITDNRDVRANRNGPVKAFNGLDTPP